MDCKVIFDNCALLFDNFGWYSILLVVGVTFLMIPLNLLYKKIMKNDSLSRLRKMISAVSVYALSLGLIAFFTAIVVKAPITAEYLFSSMLPCGFMAQVSWALIKVIKDYGFAPVVKLVAQSKEAKQWFKDVGLDSSLVDTILNSVDNYLAGVDAKTFEDVLLQETKIYQDIKTKLVGFIENDKLNEAATRILDKIKSKYQNNDK